jgi:hypothetical protein
VNVSIYMVDGDGDIRAWEQEKNGSCFCFTRIERACLMFDLFSRVNSSAFVVVVGSSGGVCGAV